MGYTNIPNNLQLAFGVSISLVDHKNQVKIRILVITVVNYGFCYSSFSYSSKGT